MDGTRLYAGRTVKVLSTNCIEVALDLGFGLHLNKRIVLEGISNRSIPKKHRNAAQHALIILVGGKRLLVHVDDTKQDGYLTGRVYLDEKVYGEPVGMTIPFGREKPLLEVSEFYRWLGDVEFDLKEVKAALNGKNGKPKQNV
jgi:hypothetical protein